MLFQVFVGDSTGNSVDFILSFDLDSVKVVYALLHEFIILVFLHALCLFMVAVPRLPLVMGKWQFSERIEGG